MAIKIHINTLLILVLSTFFNAQAIREQQSVSRPAYTFFLVEIDNRTNAILELDYQKSDTTHHIQEIRPGLTQINLPITLSTPDMLNRQVGSLFFYPEAEDDVRLEQMLVLAVRRDAIFDSHHLQQKVDVGIKLGIATVSPFAERQALTFWQNQSVINILDHDRYMIHIILEGQKLEQSRFTITPIIFPSLSH
ncbi:hypothetical protein BH09DEP1_BH09DEP1_5830 [soil metagenome]